MADRSAAVTIRLGVANAEAVKAALRGLGADGQRALKQIEDASKRPSAGMLALSDTIRASRDQLSGYGAQLGPVGAGMAALGTRGALIAGGIGLGAAALVSFAGASLQAAERFGQLNDSAAELGITVELLQALEGAGIGAGVSAEQMASALGKFTVQAGQAASGQGELIEKLRAYAPLAAQQMAAATTQAERFQILARAFEQVQDPAQRAALEVAAFGRGGIGMSRVFAEIGGDIEGFIRKMREAGVVVEGDLVRKTDEFGDRIDFASKRIQTSLAPGLSNSASHMATLYERAADFVGVIANATAPGWLQNLFARAGNASFWTSIKNALGDDPTNSWFGVEPVQPVRTRQPDDVVTGTEVFGPKPMAPNGTPAPGTPVPQAQPSAEEYKKIRLAQIALADEQAAERATRSATAAKSASAQATRDKEAADREAAQTASEVARIQLELGNATATYAAEVERVTALVGKNGLTQEEAAAKLALYRRELDETIARERERSSVLPEMARLANEAGDLTAQIDRAAAGGLRDTAGALADATLGAKSLADGFDDVAQSLSRAILQAVYMKTIINPAADAISNAFSPSTSGTPSTGGGGFLSGIGNFFSGMFGGGSTPAAAPTATAAAVPIPRAKPFRRGGYTGYGRPDDVAGIVHAGEIVWSREDIAAAGGVETVEAMRRRMPGYRAGGLVGDYDWSQPMYARGSDGRLGPVDRRPMQINIHNNAGADVQAREVPDGRGGTSLEVMVDRVVADRLTRPGSQSGAALQNTFGQRRRLTDS